MIHQRESELAPKAIGEFVPFFFVGVRDQFGVTVRFESMPMRHQLPLALGIVKEFAIKDAFHRACFVSYRLLAIRQPHNAQTAVGKPNSPPNEIAIFIRAAMKHDIRHRPNHRRIGFTPIAAKVHHPRNSTHYASSLLLGPKLGSLMQRANVPGPTISSISHYRQSAILSCFGPQVYHGFGNFPIQPPRKEAV